MNSFCRHSDEDSACTIHYPEGRGHPLETLGVQAGCSFCFLSSGICFYIRLGDKECNTRGALNSNNYVPVIKEA